MANFALNPVKYEDVRSQIVKFLTDNSEFAGQFDFTASNIGLIIDTMSYVTMLMSYQVSNTANNLFLDTTNIRKNALSIAKTMGYRPQRAIASRITGTIEYTDMTNDLSAHSIQIPVYTSFVADSGYTYVNYDVITLTGSATDIHTMKSTVTLYEGSLKTYTYLGNGNPFQSFTIPSNKVEENHFEVRVRKNNQTNSILWDEVRDSFNLLSMNSYFVEEDLNNVGYVRVVFGDKYITNYPTNDEVVDVQYLETNAELANNSKLVAAVYTNVVLSDGFPAYSVANFTDVSKTVSLSYGGTPIETLDIIKERAAKTYATVGRAVTQNDYKTLLSGYSYILKANSIGGDTLFPSDKDRLGNVYLTAIPFIQNMNANFYNSNSIYLTSDEEAKILTELDRYRIISTKLNFLKPSYISIDITPSIEIKSDASQIEVESIKTNVYNSLNTYANSLIDFAPIFRESKINGIISDVAGVVSSQFTSKYSFALTKESLYFPNVENNFIFLPVVIKSKDVYGSVYDNFVKTNQEQEILLNVSYPDVLAIEDRTIYGQLATKNNARYIYNEDVKVDGIVDTCDIKIHGKNNFFDLYRFESGMDKNNIPATSLKSFVFGATPSTISVTPSLAVSGDYQYDRYAIALNDGVSNKTIGTVVRTSNRENGFQCLIDKESLLTSTTHGDFYKAIINVPMSGADKDFDHLYKGETTIYNAEATGSVKWVKCADRGFVSAKTDFGLFNRLRQNDIYGIQDGLIGGFYDDAYVNINMYMAKDTVFEDTLTHEKFVIMADQGIIKLVPVPSTRVTSPDALRTMCDTYLPKSYLMVITDGELVFTEVPQLMVHKTTMYITDIDTTPNYNVMDRFMTAENGIFTLYNSQLANRTPAVSGGEQIIFNLNSDSIYNWDKLTLNSMALDASQPIIQVVVDYEIKKVVNLDYGQTTTFNGGTNSPTNLYNDDLIYYNAILDRWILIGNTSVSGSIQALDTVTSSPISGGSLENFIYDPAVAGAVQIGDCYLVTDIGSFGSSYSRINWPSIDDIAFDGDVILYVGNGKWNIWQESQPDTYNIDGNVLSALPIKINYADKFAIAVSGNFMMGDDSKIYTTDDFIVYTGDNTWVPLVIISYLNPTNARYLPGEARLGDMYTVNEDGSFQDSYMISPRYDKFIQGDVIIYNGYHYTKRDDYSFEYAQIDNFTTGRDYLNVLGLNSVFHYEYDYSSKYFKFFFNDIFDQTKIGSFRYQGSSLNNDIGKMTFEKYIIGNFNMLESSSNTTVKDIFDDNTINKITFLPKNKLDSKGNVTAEPETNFETNFNSFIILNTAKPTVEQ